MKRLIIFDMDGAGEKLIPVKKDDFLFSARPEVHSCVGCFGCWIRTPGACVISDRFPLYFDVIPSNLLLFMQEAERIIESTPQSASAEIDVDGEMYVHKTVLHVIVNNGFYESSQNKTAIEMAHIWGNKCGFKRGSDIAVGAGGMVQMAPMGKGPMHNLGAAMKELAGDIRSFGSKKTGSRDNSEVILVEPNFPRFLYIQCAHMGWHQMAKKNGLRAKDIEGIITKRIQDEDN